jgi:hypothetical protein
MATRNTLRGVFHRLVDALVPTAVFVAVAFAGLSVATMLPYTARAHGGCTECVHDINHWTCGPSNADKQACIKVTAAYCMNVRTECVGSTTMISGGGIDDGSDRYTFSTTTL